MYGMHVSWHECEWALEIQHERWNGIVDVAQQWKGNEYETHTCEDVSPSSLHEWAAHTVVASIQVAAMTPEVSL